METTILVSCAACFVNSFVQLDFLELAVNTCLLPLSDLQHELESPYLLCCF